MDNLIVKFDDLRDLRIIDLEKMIKGARDDISKHWIAKTYRRIRSLRRTYQLYYETKLWKECIVPLLRMWVVKKQKIGSYCPRCKRFITINQIVPHHTRYIKLAKKYHYRGFDNRQKVNNPKYIVFMCYDCHQELHGGKRV